MSRPRTVAPFLDAPTHGGEVKRCVVMTECAIHTVELTEGHFAAIVHSTPDSKIGVIALLDRDEVEAHIVLLRNAMEDAERLDAGKAPIHAAESLRRS